MSLIQTALQARVQKLNIATITKHIFICTDASKPLCCDAAVSLESWDYLKRRLKELNLETQVFRTKANCLRVCEYGPILMIYPDRTWYHSVTIPVIERILQEDIIGGQIVRDYVFHIEPVP